MIKEKKAQLDLLWLNGNMDKSEEREDGFMEFGRKICILRRKQDVLKGKGTTKGCFLGGERGVFVRFKRQNGCTGDGFG